MEAQGSEGGRGPLEGELYELLLRAASADPTAREALAAEGGKEVSPTDLIGLLVSKQAALERAVLRLARELDGQ